MQRKIKDKARDVFCHVQSLWYNVFYVALYGSQNYGIDTPASDFDWKAIIIPSLEDLVSQTKPVSKVYEYQWWQIEVKDIRNYIESAVKVNVNFIELLSTPYYYSNDKTKARELRSYFKKLLDEQGEIYLRACMWMIIQKLHALSHPYPSKLEVLEKFGYDPKQLCHIIRLHQLMVRYTQGNYSFLHEGQERDLLMKIKAGMVSNAKAWQIANAYVLEAEGIVKRYTKPRVFRAKKSLIEFSRKVIYDFIVDSFQNDWVDD